MAHKVTLPEMGEGVIEGTLARWLVKEGDRIEQFAPIAEVETDKVTTETTSDVGGIILQLCVKEGETVPVGTLLAVIGEAGEAPDGRPQTTDDRPRQADDRAEMANRSTQAAQEPLPAVVRGPSSGMPPSAEPANIYTGRISPVVGRIAAEHGVDLNKVAGTGRDGRITKQDVLAHVETAASEAPAQQPSAPAREPQTTDHGPQTTEEPSRAAVGGQLAAASAPTAVAQPTGDLLPLTSMRRSIAEHMVMSKRTSPHVTTVFEFDFSAVSAHRRTYKEQFARDGVNLTFTAYIVAATVEALKRHPMANSSWSDAGVVLKREINIGMATAIAEGLIVPVIKNADGLNLLGLARTINDLADRARSKQLKPSDVQGGTFSITNHGTSGSLFATPIINQPQCGILGVGKIEKRVKVIDDAIAIRPLAYVSFTFDHRILDGATADAFVSTIKDVIESWR